MDNENHIVKDECNDEKQLIVEDNEWDEELLAEEDALWEQEKAQRKRRKSLIVRLVGSLIIVSMLVSGFQVWFHVFNIPAIEFVNVSNRLSNQPEVQEYRKAVVRVEWGGTKGTGFNISPNGLIVTNEHVVDNANFVNVFFRESGNFKGEVLATYPEYDLAIIKVDSENLPSLKVSYQENWQQFINKEIVFIGNPLSFAQIANEGIVTGETELKNWDVPVIVIKAPVYKGNSGSPVINEEGEVIGIIFGTIRSNSNEKDEITGVAVPSFYLKDILQNLNVE